MELTEICTACNGDGYFQFSANPDDCAFCAKCQGNGYEVIKDPI